MTARTADDEFLALVCADADLLGAEFDSIIEANWGEPPPAPVPHRPVPPVRHEEPPHPHGRHDVPADALARQRSPPHGEGR
ncbi:hypothetical protein [Lentzea sp. NBRC 102530]|uniref:hypothetical protein n=1 Tax=Lentzea sp. NBRC 102530 TaxID=3032201 RepID=UPI0024A2A17A|nr:hypothetical protein [Lentzea sp. NBRC 102530]GLY50273.1 hypothetical protein Lesp01_39290 [Lentzea sp. NBRC 102530]